MLLESEKYGQFWNVSIFKSIFPQQNLFYQQICQQIVHFFTQNDIKSSMIFCYEFDAYLCTGILIICQFYLSSSNFEKDKT